MAGHIQRRFLELLCSIYLYNEHRGYTALDRMLTAIRGRWPDDEDLIEKVERHRADERKHYMMFRRWFERRGIMPFDIDRACGHIDRFVEIVFGAPIDALEIPEIAEDRNFERLCRVISLTERRGHRQVEALLRDGRVTRDAQLVRIFRIIEQDEPSHWAPYDGWLADHARPGPTARERLIDSFVHGELLLAKLPILFLAPRLQRRTTWPDQHDKGVVLTPSPLAG